MNKKTVFRIPLIFLLIGMLLFAFNIQLVKASPLPRLYLNPVVNVAMSGETFTVDIMVAEVERLYTWQVIMSFNPGILQFVNVTEGDFLKSQAPNGTWTTPPVVGDGWAGFGWSIQGPFVGPSGSGWLGTVEFLVLDFGESVLNITDPLTKLLEYIPPPPPPGGDKINPIPHTTENGYFISDELMKLTDLYDQFLALNSSYYSLLSEHQDLAGEYSGLESDYAALNAAYTSLQSNYDALNTTYASLQSNYDALNTIHTSLQATYDALNSLYDSLNSNYQSLQSDNEELQSNLNALSEDLDTARTLNYVFIITTVIFIATTIYFAIRKPKTMTTSISEL